MFIPLAGHTTLGVPPDRVVAIIESINAPNISIPDVGTEPTKAYLVGVVTPAGGYAIFCYLLQIDSNRPILYISNPQEVAIEQYSALEADAIQFAESMGFMLDNMNFRAQPPEAQMRLINELPFFREQAPRPVPRVSTGPKPVAGVGAPASQTLLLTNTADSATVARLLSSF